MATAKTPAKAPKKKMKPRGGNSPVIGNNGLHLDPGDNTNFLEVQVELFNMPDIDLNDVNQVAQRLSDYFMLYGSHDMKPTVAGMALALNGHPRQWLSALVHDRPYNSTGYMIQLNPESSSAIKKAYFMLSNLWETYMNSGKMNPVAGIFLGKNNFGMVDQVEHVVTPNTNPDSDYDSEDIKSRYLTDSQIVNEPTDSTDSE